MAIKAPRSNRKPFRQLRIYIDAKAIAATGAERDTLSHGTGASESPELVIQRFMLQLDAVDATYNQARAIETTLRAFLEIAWSLSGTPGRKSLVWVTGSFPFYLDSFTSVPGDNGLRALYGRTLQALNDAQFRLEPAKRFRHCMALRAVVVAKAVLQKFGMVVVFTHIYRDSHSSGCLVLVCSLLCVIRLASGTVSWTANVC